MVDPKDVMFCIYYDENRRILGEGDITKMRYYEIEAIRCVSSIRANGGKWSNCDIILGTEAEFKCFFIDDYDELIIINFSFFYEK